MSSIEEPKPPEEFDAACSGDANMPSVLTQNVPATAAPHANSTGCNPPSAVDLADVESFLRRMGESTRTQLGRAPHQSDWLSRFDAHFLEQLAEASDIPAGAPADAKIWFDGLPAHEQIQLVRQIAVPATRVTVRISWMMESYLPFRREHIPEHEALEKGHKHYCRKKSGTIDLPGFKVRIDQAWEWITQAYLDSDAYLGRFALTVEYEELAEIIAEEILKKHERAVEAHNPKVPPISQ